VSGPVEYCDCKCHKSPDLKWNPVGVPMLDTVAAESACSKCAKDHQWAAIKPTEMEPPRPADACGDPTDYGEGRED
jgi:hypothetical protein